MMISDPIPLITGAPPAARVSVRNLTKHYTNAAGQVRNALNGVSLDLFPGKWVSVIGASGAGKSTLLSLIGLLEPQDAGSITVDGRDTAGLSDKALSDLRAHTIGFVFQQFNLIDTMTVLDNVLLPITYAIGAPADPDAEAVARQAIDSVGLASRIQHRPGELSGGEMQRVAIARAMASSQTIILADEPTGNLDTASGAAILSLIRARCDAGAAVLVVSHDPAVAALGDAVLALKDGVVDAKNCRNVPEAVNTN